MKPIESLGPLPIGFIDSFWHLELLFEDSNSPQELWAALAKHREAMQLMQPHLLTLPRVWDDKETKVVNAG